jgi:hypothetical protein
MDYSTTELTLAVRQEKYQLVRERLELINQARMISNRLGQIDARLNELDKAECLLENGL